MKTVISRFVCSECGLSESPCRHHEKNENDRRFNWIEKALCEIVAQLRTLQKECVEVQKKLQQIEAKEDILDREADLIFQQTSDILTLLTAPRGMTIVQINSNEGNMSTPAGGSSVFQELPTPDGSQFPAGTTFSWTVDDTADISLAPSSDGTQVTATCVATPTATSYNLTCTSSFTPPGAPTPISATINVPIVVTPPTPTGMTITQLS